MDYEEEQKRLIEGFRVARKGETWKDLGNTVIIALIAAALAWWVKALTFIASQQDLIDHNGARPRHVILESPFAGCDSFCKGPLQNPNRVQLCSSLLYN